MNQDAPTAAVKPKHRPVLHKCTPFGVITDVTPVYALQDGQFIQQGFKCVWCGYIHKCNECVGLNHGNILP